MSTHNLCFQAKVRIQSLSLHTPLLVYKIGVQGGIAFIFKFSLCNTLYANCYRGARYIVLLIHDARKLSLRFPTRSDLNLPIQPQKMARSFKFWTDIGEGL